MSAAEPESAARNAVFSLVTQLTTASLTALLTVFLVRVLRPDEYGDFALALSVSAIALTASDLGISQSTGGFAAERRQRPELLRQLVIDAVKLKVLVAGVVCLVLLLVAPVIANAYDNPDLTWTLRGIALATLGQGLVLMAASVLISVGRSGLNFPVVLLESLLEVSISILLVLTAGGAAAASFGRAAGYLAGALVGLILVHRLIGRPSIGLFQAPRRETTRTLAGYASSLLVVDAAYTFTGALPVLLLGGYLGSAASGLYQAPARLTTLLLYPGLSVANGVAPRLVRQAGKPPSVREFQYGLRSIILFQCFLLAPMLVWAAPITALILGDEYRESAQVLRALVPSLFLQGFAPLLSLSVNYLGEARRRVSIALGTAAITAVSGVVLIPRLGVVGAALGSGVSTAFYVLGHWVLCRRLLDFAAAPLLRSLVCGVCAACAMGAALALYGTQDLGPIDWVLGGLAGAAMFAAVLRLTGEVRPDDWEPLIRAMRRLKPRRGV